MALFQYSHLTRSEQSISEAWTTDNNLIYWSMVDSLGNRSRIAQISVNNPQNKAEAQYFVMQRVRVTEAYDTTVFLGRILSIEPDFENSELLLTCRDYLGELADRIVLAESGDGVYSGASRNGILSKLVEEESEEPDSGQDIDRSLLPRMLQDTGNYLEKITKTYATRGMYDLDPESRVASSYDYRGTTTVLEAITDIAEEDAQQDLQVFYYTDQPTDPSNTAHINYSNKFPSTYWTDHTGGLSDGASWFHTPRGVITEAVFPTTLGTTKMSDIIYFGSNSKFDGLEYTFRQSGATIHESNYTDLEWQYWNGDSWIKFIPDYDTQFKADGRDTERVMGRTYWTSLINSTDSTITETGTNTLAATQINGSGLASGTTATSFAVDSAANFEIGGLITIQSEVMKITGISGTTVTVLRAYNDTTAATHADNIWVHGGKKQGMTDWAKRDLEQTADMHSFNDWNDNDNSKWKSWKNAWQSNAQFNYFRVPAGSGQLTTFDARYPAGTPIAHRLRDGDNLTGTNYTGFETSTYGQLVSTGVTEDTFSLPTAPNNIVLVTVWGTGDDPVFDPPGYNTLGQGTTECELDTVQGTLLGHVSINWANYSGNAHEMSSGIETYYWNNISGGSHMLRLKPPTGNAGTPGHQAYISMYSGINLASAPTIVKSLAYPFIMGGNTTVTTDRSVAITTAPGDMIYEAGIWARPGSGSYSETDPSNFTQHRSTNTSIHVPSSSHGNWYFRIGHTSADTTGTSSTRTLNINNSSGAYKAAFYAIRLQTLTPGSGDGGFLNGDNYVDVLNPYVISLYGGYTGTNTINGDSFSSASANYGVLDVSERSGVSSAETTLEVGGSVRPDDVTSEAMPSLGIGEARGTYKYWVRCFVKRSAKYALLNDGSHINTTDTSLVVDSYVTGTTAGAANALDFSAGDVVTMHTEDMLVTNVANSSTMTVARGHNDTTAATHNDNLPVNGTIPAQVSTLSLYTPPKLFRDFRAEDPKTFDEMWEYTSNIAQTTLTSGINNSTITVPVADASGLELDDVITVNSEDMLITDINSNNLTVTRGFNSGAEAAGDKAAHDSGDTVSVSLYSENNHDMTGGEWVSLNRESGNTGTGSLLLWDGLGQSVNLLENSTQALYLGSDDPFNGFEIHALQGKMLGITSVSSADPAVVTTNIEHGLTTGDYVAISGSNSGIDVDGYHAVTVTSTTAFSVAVNNSGVAGGSGQVVTGIPDYENVAFKFDILDTFPRNFWSAATDGRQDTRTAWRTIQPLENYSDLSWSGRSKIGVITDKFPLGALGPTRWRYDLGSIVGGTVHWTCEVRFNTDKPRNQVSLKNTTASPARVLPPVNPVRSFSVPEHDSAYAMSVDTSWSNRASLIGPYSSHSMGPGARAAMNNSTTTSIRILTSAYVGSTTDISLTFSSAHHCAVGDYITITDSANTNAIDGTYRVKTVTSRVVLTFDLGRTGASLTTPDTIKLDRLSDPPNTKSLYWMRIRMDGTPRNGASVRHIRTATTSRFKYFDRGKEPWVTNNTSSPRGSAANNNLDAVYFFDASKAADRIAISSSAALNGFTRLTTASSHGLAVGDTFEVLGATDSDHLKGIWKAVRVPSSTTVVIDEPYVAGGVTSAYMHRTEFNDITANLSSDSPYGKILDIASSGTGQPGIIRTAVPHQFRPNDAFICAGTSSSPPTGNVYIVNEVISLDEFTYKTQANAFVNVTSAITTGTVTRYVSITAIDTGTSGIITTRNSHGLVAGQAVTITGTAGSTPAINETILINEVLSPTKFTIPITVSGAGTVNTGYLTSPTSSLGTPQATDIIYFGSKSPFTQLRFNAISSTFANGGAGAGTWEYFKGSHDGKSSDWMDFHATDLTGGFKGYLPDGNSEMSFFTPGFGFWKSAMAGQKDATAANTGQAFNLNKRFGDAYYFIRFRYTTNAASAISLRRVWCGPNTWNPDLSTNTLAGQNNYRHASDLTQFGLTVDDRSISMPEASTLRVIGYSLKDLAQDFVNIVTVRGRAGSFATARDEESIRKFRIVKEKVVDDSTLTNDTQCQQRAIALLQQLKASTSIEILDITAASPSVITTGGSYKYLTYTDNNDPMQTTLFEMKGIQIKSNSAQSTIRTSKLDGAINNQVGTTQVTVELTDVYGRGAVDFAVGQIILIDSEQLLITSAATAGNNTIPTVFETVRAVNGTTIASHSDEADVYIYNQTYINTETAHNLITGDKVLITDVANTAPRYQGVGAFSTTENENTVSYNYVHKVFVTGQKQFYIQTADSVANLATLDYELSDRTVSPASAGLDNAFDAVGSIIHSQAKTTLVVGDQVKLFGTVTTAANETLQTISKIDTDRSTFELADVSAGTTPTDSLGYAFIAEPHGLNTSERVNIRGSNSVPSIDGYRSITRVSNTTFSIQGDLSQGRAGSDGVLIPSSIKQATVTLSDFPVYSAGNGMPKVLRAGDLVNVYLDNAAIVTEDWLVYSITTGARSGGTDLVLFRDLSSVSEPGEPEKQLLRDLSSQVRETANAVFQPIDKSVQNSLDFMPEGPSRPTIRMNMDSTDLSNSIDIPGPGLNAGNHTQSFPDDFRLSWQMYENFPTRETVSKDLLRVDMQGLRADESGDATGGAGLTFIARDATDGVTGATPDFHPNDGEATLYLRKSDTANEGTGLYLAHRGVFNSGATYDEWDTDTPKAQAEVFVGLSGRKAANSSGQLSVVLPALTSNPRIMANTESNGYVQITNSTTSATLTARDAAGNAINGAVINYVVLFNSTKNTSGLNAHF